MNVTEGVEEALQVVHLSVGLEIVDYHMMVDQDNERQIRGSKSDHPHDN